MLRTACAPCLLFTATLLGGCSAASTTTPDAGRSGDASLNVDGALTRGGRCVEYERPAEPLCPEGDIRAGDPCCVDFSIDGVLFDNWPTTCEYGGEYLRCDGQRWVAERADERAPTCFGVPEPSEPTCRSDDDCDFGDCVHAVPAGPLCGAVSAPERECDSGGCDEGFACEEYESADVCVDGLNSRCIERCTAESCEPDETCGPEGLCVPRACTDGFDCGPELVCGVGGADPVDEHGCRAARCGREGGTCREGFECDEDAALPGFLGCVPISCMAGFDCGPIRFCDPSDPNAESLHGCVQRECSSDTDCDCGACVFGRCEERAFVCFSPPPSPAG